MRSLFRGSRIAFETVGGVQREDSGILVVVVWRLRWRERAVLRGVRGLSGESRPALLITSSPDVEGRAILAIVGGPARDSRVGLVVNAHISAS
jgi:hypothetical protein